MKPEIEVLPTAALASQAAADRFVVAANDAIRTRGEIVVALSGGSTPRSMYERLAADALAVDWSRIQVLWSDERCVPPDDAASNYRMAREALLDHVPIPDRNVHRIRGEDDPGEAAYAYERMLRGVLEGGDRIDLILLGLGEDGHTASLFPGAVEVHDSERWVKAAHHVRAEPAWRITFTPIIINAAAEVHFLVTDGAKASVLRDVLEGPRRPHELPAQLVAPVAGRVIWFVGAAVASALRERSASF